MTGSRGLGAGRWGRRFLLALVFGGFAAGLSIQEVLADSMVVAPAHGPATTSITATYTYIVGKNPCGSKVKSVEFGWDSQLNHAGTAALMRVGASCIAQLSFVPASVPGANLAPGAHTIVAGPNLTVAASAEFTIDPAVTITLTPTSGLIGKSFTAEAALAPCPPSSSYTFRFYWSSTGNAPFWTKTAPCSTGQSPPFTPPAGSAVGGHPVIVSVIDPTGAPLGSATATYTITSPPPTPSPTPSPSRSPTPSPSRSPAPSPSPAHSASAAPSKSPNPSPSQSSKPVAGAVVTPPPSGSNNKPGGNINPRGLLIWAICLMLPTGVGFTAWFALRGGRAAASDSQPISPKSELPKADWLGPIAQAAPAAPAAGDVAAAEPSTSDYVDAVSDDSADAGAALDGAGASDGGDAMGTGAADAGHPTQGDPRDEEGDAADAGGGVDAG